MHILLATDGSEYSRFATRLLSRIPFPPDTKLTIMTCVEGTSSKELETEIGAGAQSLYDQIHKRARQILDEETDHLNSTGWTISKVLCEGGVAPEILKISRELGVDLITLGARGHSTLEQLLLGSVSRKVTRHAHCSVLVARPSAGSPPSDAVMRILVGVDGSDSAGQAVRLLSGLSWQKPIHVTLLRVIELVRPFRMDILQQMDPLWQNQRREAEENLKEAAELLTKTVSRVETLLQEGDSAAEVLFRRAREENADILMLGDKGRNLFGNFLLGSLTEEALHHAPCSVWLSRLCEH